MFGGETTLQRAPHEGSMEATGMESVRRTFEDPEKTLRKLEKVSMTSQAQPRLLRVLWLNHQEDHQEDHFEYQRQLIPFLLPQRGGLHQHQLQQPPSL